MGTPLQAEKIPSRTSVKPAKNGKGVNVTVIYESDDSFDIQKVSAKCLTVEQMIAFIRRHYTPGDTTCTCCGTKLAECTEQTPCCPECNHVAVGAKR